MKIVCLGDSITDNRDSSNGKSYVDYWQELIDQAGQQHQLINAGVNGETAQDGYYRLNSDVLPHQPDLVTIMFGHNELGRGLSVDHFESYLNLLIQKLTKTLPHTKVWILTPNKVADPHQQSRYKPLLARLRVPDPRFTLIDIWQAFEGQDLDSIYSYQYDYNGLTGQDWLHPNAHGHRLIAKTLATRLNETHQSDNK